MCPGWDWMRACDREMVTKLATTMASHGPSSETITIKQRPRPGRPTNVQATENNFRDIIATVGRCPKCDMSPGPMDLS